MAQITEDYVSYETAKLLKEKGFNEYCYGYYYTPEYMSYGDTKQRNLELFPDSYSAPTLQMAMKWLRETHKIEIRVIYDNDKRCWYGACNPMNESQILLGLGRKSKSYEDACEAAIRYCLENLI